jgi:hypothetical protein
MWEQHKFDMKLVAPHNRRRFKVIVVGTGLAGGAAAATLGELGYDVHAFTFHDSPRRAHSIAAQGGINAAKNYKGDGDSIYRLFYDTVKGGDFRAREANVYRLAQISVDIIDQCVAQGVPFAREYGGLLDNRSFGGAQVSRTFYARGQTGQQLLLGCYQALARQIGAGTVTIYPRSEMLDLVVKDGRACGIVVRNLLMGGLEVGIGEAGEFTVGGGEAGEGVDEVGEFFDDDGEGVAHEEDVGVIDDVHGGSAEVDNRFCLRALHPEGLHVAHHIVADLGLDRLGILEIDVVEVPAHLLKLKIRDRETERLFRLRKREPEPAPGGEFLLIREVALHLLAPRNGPPTGSHRNRAYPSPFPR